MTKHLGKIAGGIAFAAVAAIAVFNPGTTPNTSQLTPKVSELAAPFTSKRSDRWESFAKKCKGEHPQCAYCGEYGDDKAIEAHHKHAFELMSASQRGSDEPGGELDPANIILLCRPDHLAIGHNGNFKTSNPNVEADCKSHSDELKAAGKWPSGP